MGRDQNRIEENRFSLSSLDYYTIIKDLLRNWWVILMAGAIAFMSVTVVTRLIYKPLYTSNATLMVTGTASNSSSFSTYSTDAERFARILEDEYLRQEVAEDLELTRLDADISAEVIAETNMINLRIVASSPSRAYEVGKGLMKHYEELSSMMYPDYYLLELVPVTYPDGASNYVEISSTSKKACFLAMFGMALLVAVCSALYDNIKNRKDAENKLDTKVYGVIYHEKKKRRGILKKDKTALLVNAPVISQGFVESYKHLRERVVTRTRRSGKKTILVTSMLENEGKSTVAANLALSLASISDKVLLIDADLRKPSVHKIFEVEPGTFTDFTDYLLGEEQTDPDAIMYHDDKTGVYLFMESHGNPRSSEIIDMPGRMEKLLEQVHKRMDYVIIDTPPMAQVSDAESIAKFADYSLLVLKPDNSKTSLINECIADLDACPAALLGCVLNNVHTVSRWIWQNLHIDVSRFVSTDTNDSSYGFGTGLGYGYGYSGQSKKKFAGPEGARSIETGESFFHKPVKKGAAKKEEYGE